jgi:hypothetical protein
MTKRRLQNLPKINNKKHHFVHIALLGLILKLYSDICNNVLV